MKVAIATAFYEIRAFTPYISSLLETTKVLRESGIGFEWIEHSGDAYVDHAKNVLIGKFMQSDCTDMVIIDSDMSWNAEGFVRLISAPVDIVGGVFPCKNKWEHYPCAIDCATDGTPIGNKETGLIRASMIPAGFMRLTKRVCNFLYKAHEFSRFEWNGIDCRALFETKYFQRNIGSQDVGTVFHGEDAVFCKKCDALGLQIWVEPRVTFNHYGLKAWNGNYHDFLTAQNKPDGTL
jgi:hypothetical protein